MKIILLKVLFLTILLAGGRAQAQESLNIAAVVNDEVISVFDLNERLSLVMASSQSNDDPEVRRRLAPQILRGLIDEKLKLQEAKRLNVTVSQEELDDALASMERRNNLPKGGLDTFLRQMGIGKAAMVSQIEAEISWARIVGLSFTSTIHISDEEVDEKLAEFKANAGKPELLAAEILLPIETPESEKEMQLLANRLSQQIASGNSFEALARSFSQSASAATGGAIGWVKQGQLGSALDNALAKLTPGGVTPPIRTMEGYYILKLIDRRASQSEKTADEIVSLQQLFIPLPKNATREEEASQMQLAATMSEMSTTCAEMDSLSSELRSPMSGNLGKVSVSKLPEPLRKTVAGLPVNKAAPPIRNEQGIIVIMVCEREGGGEDAAKADRNMIRSSLMNQRLDIAARRYLRDLRSSAFVDTRI